MAKLEVTYKIVSIVGTNDPHVKMFDRVLDAKLGVLPEELNEAEKKLFDDFSSIELREMRMRALEDHGVDFSDDSEHVIGKAHYVKVSLPGIKAGQPPILRLDASLQAEIEKVGYLVLEGPGMFRQQMAQAKRALSAHFGAIKSCDLLGKERTLFDTFNREELIRLARALETRYRMSNEFLTSRISLRTASSEDEQASLIEHLLSIQDLCPGPIRV